MLLSAPIGGVERAMAREGLRTGSSRWLHQNLHHGQKLRLVKT